jgi:hypothetical protein
VLLNACKDIGLAMNLGKIVHGSRTYWGMMTNNDTRVSTNFYENVKAFIYLGSLLTNKNSILQGIACRVKAWNSYYSVQTLLYRLLSKNLKLKIYKTIICMPFALYG